MESIISNIYKNKLTVKKKIGLNNDILLYEGILNNNKINDNDNKIIIKVIPRKDLSNFKKLLLEIGFLKYLSKYVSSKKYIYLCYSAKLTDDYLIVVQEAPKGITLTEFIKLIMNLSFEEYNKLSLVLMYKLLLAINYIHTKSVAHRALNPDTIYIDYDKKNNRIIDIKLTDFSVSCGKFIDFTNNNEDSKYKYCDTIEMEINPPEKFNINALVKKIQKLINNETRESTYLYLAKKADIWSLGIIFWKLLNRNNLKENPLNIKFPTDYNKTTNWRTFNGVKSKLINNMNILIKKIFNEVVNMMLSEIPYRSKSNEILEKFIIINKYYDDYDDDLKN